LHYALSEKESDSFCVTPIFEQAQAPVMVITRTETHQRISTSIPQACPLVSTQIPQREDADSLNPTGLPCGLFGFLLQSDGAIARTWPADLPEANQPAK